MRCKVKIKEVRSYESYFQIMAEPVQDKTIPENINFNKFTPNGVVNLNICNPVLKGKIQAGEEYYVDFTLASKQEQPA